MRLFQTKLLKSDFDSKYNNFFESISKLGRFDINNIFKLHFKDNKLRIFLLILSGLPEPPFLAGAGDVFFGPAPIPTLL